MLPPLSQAFRSLSHRSKPTPVVFCRRKSAELSSACHTQGGGRGFRAKACESWLSSSRRNYSRLQLPGETPCLSQLTVSGIWRVRADNRKSGRGCHLSRLSKSMSRLSKCTSRTSFSVYGTQCAVILKSSLLRDSADANFTFAILGPLSVHFPQ